MANRERGEVAFDAAGTAYTLRYNTDALCEIEDATGLGIGEIGAQMGDPAGMRIKLLRAVLWGGLIDKQPDATLQTASGIMDAVGLQAVGEKIQEAFNAAFPEPAEGRDSDRPPTAAGTGKTSSAASSNADARKASSGN